VGLVLCILGFTGVAWSIRRNVADGLGLLLVIGSLYGIARCRIFDGYSHFLFDAATLGAYAGTLPRLAASTTPSIVGLKKWVYALASLLLLLILVSPLIDAQPVSVQLLGLRPAIFFLPFLLIGAALKASDARRLAWWCLGVALGTAVVALAEYTYGVEPFFPINEASRIIYLSRDIGEERAIRIPSTFSSAHAYGGTMVALVPLLILLLDSGRRRSTVLAISGLAAACLGVFACAARLPFLGLLAVLGAVLFRGARRPGIRIGGLVVLAVLALVVSRNERLQRFETLSDSEYVSNRVRGSLNESFLEILSENPIGRGLGSAVGTSIPYFLLDEAKPQVGMENEFARIGVEQGILGFLLWLVFGVTILARKPGRLQKFGGIADVGMWVFCIYSWASGFIGTGFLASVPGTMMLMLFMGAIASTKAVETAESSTGLVSAKLANQQGA